MASYPSKVGTKITIYRTEKKQTEEEKLQLEEKCRQMEAQNKHLEEMHNNFLMKRQDQQTNNTQRQPNIKITYEGWGIMFGQAREQIMCLIKENRKKSTGLKEMSDQLQDREAFIKEIQLDLQGICTERIRSSKESSMKAWKKPQRKSPGHKTERHAVQTPRHGDKMQSAANKAEISAQK